MPTVNDAMDAETRARLCAALRTARVTLEELTEAVRAALVEAGIDPDEPDDDEAA
jgi:hypothetical protein